MCVRIVMYHEPMCFNAHNSLAILVLYYAWAFNAREVFKVRCARIGFFVCYYALVFSRALTFTAWALYLIWTWIKSSFCLSWLFFNACESNLFKLLARWWVSGRKFCFNYEPISFFFIRLRRTPVSTNVIMHT